MRLFFSPPCPSSFESLEVKNIQECGEWRSKLEGDQDEGLDRER